MAYKIDIDTNDSRMQNKKKKKKKFDFVNYSYVKKHRSIIRNKWAGGKRESP